MPLTLYAHPFSSYSQKVLIALYENETSFTFRTLSEEDPEAYGEMTALWPLKRFPVLVDDGRPVMESSIIIEHLERNYPGSVSLLPEEAAAALEVRLLDRIFDGYVMTPVQKVVEDSMREEQQQDPKGVADARNQLDIAYQWLDEKLAGRRWATGDAFTLADCAAAPSLFYADWTHPIASAYQTLRSYRARLLERPSFARAIEDARPYRHLFPLGAPDRD